MTILSVSECAKLASVTKRTIQNKIQAGKLSASRDDSGYYQIDSSEFFRVYPDANNLESNQENSFLVGEDKNQVSNHEIELLRTELAAVKRENELLKQQLSKSENREVDLIDTLKSNTRLLEHHSEIKKKKIFGLF